VRRPTVVFTDRSRGDLAIDSPGVDARRAAVAPVPWTWLRQVHGSRVVVVDEPGQHAGTEADAAVTATPGCVLAVQVADCAPIALVGSSTVGVVHAGWRGLVAGVVGNAVDAMRSLGAADIEAVVGPSIEPACYEFGADDLESAVRALGERVRARTRDGAPALDVRAGVRAALEAAGVDRITEDPTCTACSPLHWSYRAGGDRARQAVVAWM
jgi:YfiH family protein